jgi:hypothetical protein
LRASGKRVEVAAGAIDYWSDLALVGGRDRLVELTDLPRGRKLVSARRNVKVFGWALDAGVRLATALPGEPIFTAAFAVGSGGRNPHRSFRQTGLQCGDEEFRTYGEILRPELGNLRIPSVAAVLPVLGRSQVELAFRNFRQLHAVPFLCDGRLEIDPTGRHKNLGNEYMLTALLEEWRKIELEIVGAVFHAGRAYGAASGGNAFSLFNKLTISF